MTAWFSGTYETSRDMAILAARREHGSTGWSMPRVIADVPERALGQPVFLTTRNGEVLLFFVVITKPEAPPPTPRYNMLPPPSAWNSAQPYWQKSHDSGHTWEDPQQLLDYSGLMFRSRPLVLPDRIILPVYDENTWESRMLISDDDGFRWRLTNPIVSPPGNIHASLVQLSDGRILAYLRSRGPNSTIWRTESSDYGETWSQPTATSLPNPNSGICLLRLNSGRLALAFNNSHTSRTPFCIALAGEEENWEKIRILEDAEGEFSYPTMMQTDDSRIHLVYTYQREHIQYACFTEDWIENGIQP
jgi:predicted neuraminidase